MKGLDPYIEQLKQWATEPDITWEELAERVNNLGGQTSEASIRRFFKKHKLSKSGAQDNSSLARALRTTEGVQTVEDKLRDELDIAKAELKTAEQVIKRYRERETIEERIVDTIDTALADRAVDFSQPVLSKPRFKGAKSVPHEFVLMLSDAHYGEVVNPDEALGLKYDTDVCRRRIEEIRDVTFRVAELKGEVYPIQKITIASLGDMVSGNIHDELEVTNSLTMVDQTVDMAHILFNLCSDMSQVFPEVEMIVKVGNHPRIHKKPRFKGKFDNWEYMMGQMVAGMAKYALPDVKIVVPKDLVYVHDVFNYRIGMVHGDGVKSNSFAGIPFYGLRNQREAVQALMSQVGQTRIDMFMMGHFHQYVFWGGECDIIINGSIKGGDEYGIGTRLSAPDPEQLLLEWHPKHGVTSKTVIKLGHVT